MCSDKNSSDILLTRQTNSLDLFSVCQRKDDLHTLLEKVKQALSQDIAKKYICQLCVINGMVLTYRAMH